MLFGGGKIEIGNATSALSLAFAEAYHEAKSKDPLISDNIKIYACSVNYPDAFAFGRSTILISDPAGELSQNQIKVLLLEKFAQFSNHDSERFLLLIAGNFVFVFGILLIKILVYLFVAFIGIILSLIRAVLGIITGNAWRGMGGFLAISAYFRISKIISSIIETVLLFLLNILLKAALLSASANYYINDQFVCACGFCNELRHYLQYIERDNTEISSTLGTISNSRPSRLARLSRLDPVSSQIHEHTLTDVNSRNNRELLSQEQNRISRPSFRVISRSSNNTPSNNEHVSGFRVVSNNGSDSNEPTRE